MEYTSKIRRKNIQGEYDTIYPVTKTSALIIDSVSELSDTLMNSLSSGRYDMRVRTLGLDRLEYSPTLLWDGESNLIDTDYIMAEDEYGLKDFMFYLVEIGNDKQYAILGKRNDDNHVYISEVMYDDNFGFVNFFADLFIDINNGIVRFEKIVESEALNTKIKRIYGVM